MKKIIAVVLIAGLAAFIATGIANKDDNDKSDNKTKTTEVPKPRITTPTTEDNSAKALACLEAGQTIQDGLETMSEGIDLLPYSSDADARSFLATAREFTATSIETVRLCAEFAPVEAAELLTVLRQLDAALAEAELLY